MTSSLTARSARSSDTATRARTWAAPTAWGPVLITTLGDDVVAVDPPSPRPSPNAEAICNAPAVAREVADRIAAYVEGDTTRLASAVELRRWLDAAGDQGFRLEARIALAKVPHGRTVTYGQLAELAGRPRAARAAGSACATNPLPLLVPCHRVLPASGGLGNFGFLGPRYKRRLLELEGALRAGM